jgi:hypothetical protein
LRLPILFDDSALNEGRVSKEELTSRVAIRTSQSTKDYILDDCLHNLAANGGIVSMVVVVLDVLLDERTEQRDTTNDLTILRRPRRLTMSAMGRWPRRLTVAGATRGGGAIAAVLVRS